jgi:flagellar motility protein MotE (MotC chaperone)
LNRTISTIALGAVCLAAPFAGAQAQDTSAPRKASPESAAGPSLTRYCANAGATVAELRLARQMKRLTELEAGVKMRVQQLEQKEAEVREWVSKRQSMLQKASDNTVAIFSKMDPEAAATRIGILEDEIAAAILAKLPPRAASAILNEMEVARAGKLTSILSGAQGSAKKS